MQLLSTVVISVIIASSASASSPALERCQKTPASCAEVDIDDPSAQVAYETGCKAGEAYVCYLLGQFHEVKNKDLPEAVKAYEQSCTLKYQEGCKDEKDLRAKLCFLRRQKAYCKGEPEGEYRIFVFLNTLDAKYQDAFVNHNFSTGLTMSETKNLYAKRMREKNPALLTALKLSLKNGHHDGHDTETLERDIRKLKKRR